jgi:hypothetical protein
VHDDGLRKEREFARSSAPDPQFQPGLSSTWKPVTVDENGGRIVTGMEVDVYEDESKMEWEALAHTSGLEIPSQESRATESPLRTVNGGRIEKSGPSTQQFTEEQVKRPLIYDIIAPPKLNQAALAQWGAFATDQGVRVPHDKALK